jgi:hypothetical protein
MDFKISDSPGAAEPLPVLATDKERKPRQYRVKIVFDNGRATPWVLIAAYDGVGAAAKLTGILSDQGREAVEVRLEYVTMAAMVGPNGRHLIIPRPEIQG